ncbi:hypothetical protein BKA70DRAFT_1266028 [Coprinopsis sp. MPI-PUGE-AT-0042]|nr:hypothetical protein BKA70DRAFT_1266028 [Coprinopsis sp. MPI-PUGE-AT-0042]
MREIRAAPYVPRTAVKPSPQWRRKQNEPDGPLRSVELERTLTYKIGYLTATNAEYWSAVLEICDRASLNEANAKEAVRALRREFKYGRPHAQLAAAKLWAMMLRGSADIFVSECSQPKVLHTLEDFIKSGQSTPVVRVRDRLLEIIAAAAYASEIQKNGSESDGFPGLWLRVKPADKQGKGIPYASEDALFKLSPARAHNDSSLTAGNFELLRESDRTANLNHTPHDEDSRRLFQ